jgi:PhnB protein
MASLLNPYLNFLGTAREAMEFYQGVFGGTLAVNTLGEYGEQNPDVADNVMHARLETDRGFTLMASDLPPGETINAGSNIALSLSGDDADELRGYWAKLSDGGAVQMPLAKQVWGDTFGMCTDRFGLPWMVNITESAG